MKTLLVVRHAKSSWASVDLTDFDRPLNDRGKNDAPKMGKRLVKNKVKINAFVSSPAKRAKRTAEYFMEQYDKKEKELILVPGLYHASPKDFKTIVAMQDNKYDSIALFSHNPGITYFVNSLTDITIDNMPTCGVFAVRSQAATWTDFIDSPKEFWFFEFPKKEESTSL